MENSKPGTQDYSPEKVQEILDVADATYSDFIKHGRYKDLLIKFGMNDVSLNNLLYALSQAQNMSVIKNMTEWNGLGRDVIPMSDSLEILSPTKVNEEKTATKDGDPVIDKRGQPVMRKTQRVTGFHPAYVFDVSCTEGAPYKPFKLDESLKDSEKSAFLDGISAALAKRKYRFRFADKDKTGNARCKIDSNEKIVYVKKGMSSRDTVLTLLDATARTLAAHSKAGYDFKGIIDEQAAAVEAASMDCIIAAHYGLSTEGYDFSAVDAWDDERKENFRENLNVVCGTTKTIFNKVDYAFYKKQQNAAFVESSFAADPLFPCFGDERSAAIAE